MLCFDEGRDIISYSHRYAPVAQSDRALASGAKGCAFDSRRAHHSCMRLSCATNDKSLKKRKPCTHALNQKDINVRQIMV